MGENTQLRSTKIPHRAPLIEDMACFRKLRDHHPNSFRNCVGDCFYSLWYAAIEEGTLTDRDALETGSRVCLI